MSECRKTDAELLQCSPQVDSTLFPKAVNNKIVQDYGKTDIYLQLDWQISKINTIYIFLSDKKFQVTSHFQYVLVECSC